MPAKSRQIGRIAAFFALTFFVGCGAENNEVKPDVGMPADVDLADGGVDAREAGPATRFKVATFNVGRYFDTVCDSNNCGDASDFEREMSDAEFAFKTDQIAGGLDKLDADIITLQEVENDNCLNALVAELPGYTFSELGEIGGTATLDVAILARGFTHLETRLHRADTQLNLIDGRIQRFARELLEVHLEKEGKRVVVFAAHFKAQRNDDPEWRLGEATAARAIAEATQEEFPDAFVYLGGDLNDEPGSPPIDALTSGGGLISVTARLPDDEIWTYAYINNRIAIDHLMHVPGGTGELVSGSASVVRDASGAFGGSDHAALAAEFDVWLE